MHIYTQCASEYRVCSGVDEEINDVKYFYDIETGKKYIMLSIKSENHKDGSVGYVYYTEKYEI